jgi:hypothetical protein
LVASTRTVHIYPCFPTFEKSDHHHVLPPDCYDLKKIVLARVPNPDSGTDIGALVKRKTLGLPVFSLGLIGRGQPPWVRGGFAPAVAHRVVDGAVEMTFLNAIRPVS